MQTSPQIGTWPAATTALNLIAHAFCLGNVLMRNRHCGIVANGAMQRSGREDLYGPLEVTEWSAWEGALVGGPMDDGNLWFGL